MSTIPNRDPGQRSVQREFRDVWEQIEILWKLISARAVVNADTTDFGFTEGTGADNGSPVAFYRDEFTLASATPTLTLTFEPVLHSQHVYLNGIEQDEGVGSDYTIDGGVITVLSGMGAISGDIIDVRYATLDQDVVPAPDVDLDLIVYYGSSGWKYKNDYTGDNTYADPDYDDSDWTENGTGVLHQDGMAAVETYTTPFIYSGNSGSVEGLGTEVGDPQPGHGPFNATNGEFWVRRLFPAGEDITVKVDGNNYWELFIDGVSSGGTSTGARTVGKTAPFTKTEPWVLAVHTHAGNGQVPAACDIEVLGVEDGVYGFTEDFNRANRDLVYNKGWYPTHSAPLTGKYEINNNRLRATAGTSGFPGSSGTIGTPIAHDTLALESADKITTEFDIVTGTLSASSGWLYFVMAGTANSTPTINSGALLRWLVSGSNNLLVQKITATNAVTDHSPGTFPTLASNATTTVKVELTRSTGVLKIWINGTLQYTSSAGAFSGLTGSITAIQFSQSYATCPIEIDNLQVY